MTDASTAASEPDTLRSLWDEAWGWLADVFDIFHAPDHIATVGVTRRTGLRIKNWLWSIEAMLRRLIIATAVQISLKLPAPKQDKPRAKPNATGRKRGLASFRIFSIHRPLAPPPQAGEVSRTAEGDRPKGEFRPEVQAPGKVHRQSSLASDPLLVIGRFEARRPRTSPARVSRKPGRGRRSRWDPLYQYDEAREAASLSRYYFGPFRTYPDCTMPDPPRRPRVPRTQLLYGHRVFISDREAILQAEAEETALHPAPGLARRIAALKRLFDDPNPAIRRLARRLLGRPDLIGALGGSLWLTPKKAKSDKTPPPPAQSLVARICLFVGEHLPKPDTS